MKKCLYVWKKLEINKVYLLVQVRPWAPNISRGRPIKHKFWVDAQHLR
jgi:hypothetical protein